MVRINFSAVLPAFLFVITPLLLPQSKPPEEILTNDHYRYIAVNQIKMWVSNNGSGSYDPNTANQGFLWPGGINATQGAVYRDGLIYGGKINGELRVNGNTHRNGLQAGKIIDGIPDDPTLPKYRIYKARKDWQSLPPGEERDQYETDLNEWPWQDGASWTDNNDDGVYTPGIDYPDWTGSDLAWYVANDMDSVRTLRTYGTRPIGLEFQTTSFAFSDTRYEDMIYKKYLMINKSESTIDSMFVSYWADADMGNGSDDYAGCDSLLNLGYIYNGDDSDEDYGAAPPAIGYDYLQTPVEPGSPADSAFFKGKWHKGYKSIGMSSFTFTVNCPCVWFMDPYIGQYSGAVMFYNYMHGIHWDSVPVIDPQTRAPAKFWLSGDPSAGTGWYEGEGWPEVPGSPMPYGPEDMRLMITAGPFTFQPKDTQEVVIGIVIGRGTSYINSIQVMKEKDLDLKRLYYSDFQPGLVDVKEDPNQVSHFSLDQNYPNPFNNETKIQYTVAADEKISLKLFNILGKEIRILEEGLKTKGNHKINFNASGLPSGIYIYELRTGSNHYARKMVLLK